MICGLIITDNKKTPFYFLKNLFEKLPFLIKFGSKVKVLLGFGLVSLLSFIVPNIPFIFSNSFIEMVFQNREQVKLFESSLLIGGYSFYLVPAAYILLLFKGISIKGFNRDVFVMFLAFSFGIILLFIPPMQGWYMWLIPFLIYFYSCYSYGSLE